MWSVVTSILVGSVTDVQHGSCKKVNFVHHCKQKLKALESFQM